MSLTCAPLVRVAQRDLTHCLVYLVEMAEMGRTVHQGRMEEMALQVLLVQQGRMEEMALQVLLVHQVTQPWVI